jgi:hypothetical protein
MDERAFGTLSKRVAAIAETRRGVSRAVVAGVMALALGMPAKQSADAAFGYCQAPGVKCNRDKKCCSGHCKSDGTCGCNSKGAPCLNRHGSVCCSQSCRNGKCQ